MRWNETRAVGQLLLLITIGGVAIASPAPARAATTIDAKSWNAYVDSNAVNACFPGFVVSFEEVDAIAAPPPVQLPHAKYVALSYGDALARPMATQILGPDAKPSALSAERDGPFVSYVVAAPGETARGFVPGGAPLPAIDPGPTGADAALSSRFDPALAAIPAGGGLTKCGYTRVLFVDEKSPDTGASIQLILQNGKIVGGVETRL